jgi:hypothetical protein
MFPSGRSRATIGAVARRIELLRPFSFSFCANWHFCFFWLNPVFRHDFFLERRGRRLSLRGNGLRRKKSGNIEKTRKKVQNNFRGTPVLPPSSFFWVVFCLRQFSAAQPLPGQHEKAQVAGFSCDGV